MSRCQKRQAKRQTRPGKGVKTHFKKRTPGPAAPDPASNPLLPSSLPFSSFFPRQLAPFFRRCLGIFFFAPSVVPAPLPAFFGPPCVHRTRRPVGGDNLVVTNTLTETLTGRPCGRGLILEGVIFVALEFRFPPLSQIVTPGGRVCVVNYVGRTNLSPPIPRLGLCPNLSPSFYIHSGAAAQNRKVFR